MNILQIVPRLDLGGVERGVVDFSKFLVEQGHKAVVISSGGRLVAELESAGVKHYRLPVNKKSFFAAWSCLRQVKSIIIDEKIDIVHCRSRVPDWIGYFACLKTPARFIVTAHGYYSLHLFSKIISLSRVVISPSQVIARHLKNNFRINVSKIRVVPRGVDIDSFLFRTRDADFQSAPRILFLGRISPVKGIEYLIEAVNMLRGIYPGVKCFISGEADKKHTAYKEYLIGLVKRYGLSANIEFTGLADSFTMLEKADFLVLPSLIPESFGRALIEAQAVGVVAIASGLGAPAQIIDQEKTGFLVPAFDALAIKDAILRVFNDKELFKKIVFAARNKVEQEYTLLNMSISVLNIYKEVLSCLTILAVKLSSLGDVVLATASLKTIKHYFPDSHITVVVSRKFLPIVENLSFIDQIIIHEDSLPKIRELFRLSVILAKNNYDVFLDLQNNRFSHLLGFFSFPKKSIGVDRKFGFLLDKKADYKKVKDLPALESQKEIIKFLGIRDIGLPYLQLDKAGQERVRDLLSPDIACSGIAGINMGASEKWRTKNIPLGFIQEIVEYLTETRNMCVVLTGVDSYFLRAQEIRDVFPDSVYNLCGKTNLKELVNLISMCSLFITPDSAPLHIASALGVMCLGIFGPTDPVRHIFRTRNTFVYQKDIDCRACYKKHCKTLKCMDIRLDDLKWFLDKK